MKFSYDWSNKKNPPEIEVDFEDFDYDSVLAKAEQKILKEELTKVLIDMCWTKEELLQTKRAQKKFGKYTKFESDLKDTFPEAIYTYHAPSGFMKIKPYFDLERFVETIAQRPV